MDAVEIEEEGDGFVDVGFIVEVAFGVSEGSADEHGGAVAEVAGDDVLGELRFVEVGEGGVDGVAEIDSRVDEGAVEVEDDEAGLRGCDLGHEYRISGAGFGSFSFVARQLGGCRAMGTMLADLYIA